MTWAPFILAPEAKALADTGSVGASKPGKIHCATGVVAGVGVTVLVVVGLGLKVGAVAAAVVFVEASAGEGLSSFSLGLFSSLGNVFSFAIPTNKSAKKQKQKIFMSHVSRAHLMVR